MTDLSNMLDVTIDTKLAELVVLRANASEAEREQRIARQAVIETISAIKASCSEADRAVALARQAVSDKEQEISNIWSQIDNIIEDAP